MPILSKNMTIFYNQFAQNTNCDLPLNTENPVNIIRETYSNCDRCELSKTRKNIVFGYGAIKPKIMFIGLGPSDYDSEIGIPFSDIPGRKLQGIVEFLTKGYKGHGGLKLANNIYYSQLILCPFSAKQLTKSIAACGERLDKEIELVKPDNIILLGFDTAKAFFENKDTMYDPEIISYVVNIKKRYLTIYVLHSLKELCFKRDAVKDAVKNTLLDILDEINDSS